MINRICQAGFGLLLSLAVIPLAAADPAAAEDAESARKTGTTLSIRNATNAAVLVQITLGSAANPALGYGVNNIRQLPTAWAIVPQQSAPTTQGIFILPAKQLAVGGPWQERALTPRLYLMFLRGRSKALQQLLVAAGADSRRSLAEVRAQLLEEVGLAGMSTDDVRAIDAAALEVDLKSVGMDERLMTLLVSATAHILRDRRV